MIMSNEKKTIINARDFLTDNYVIGSLDHNGYTDRVIAAMEQYAKAFLIQQLETVTPELKALAATPDVQVYPDGRPLSASDKFKMYLNKILNDIPRDIHEELWSKLTDCIKESIASCALPKEGSDRIENWIVGRHQDEIHGGRELLTHEAADKKIGELLEEIKLLKERHVQSGATPLPKEGMREGNIDTELAIAKAKLGLLLRLRSKLDSEEISFNGKWISIAEYREGLGYAISALMERRGKSESSPSVEPGASEIEKILEWASIEGWDFWPNFPGTSLQAKGAVWIKEGSPGEEKLPTTADLIALYQQHSIINK